MASGAGMTGFEAWASKARHIGKARKPPNCADQGGVGQGRLWGMKRQRRRLLLMVCSGLMAEIQAEDAPDGHRLDGNIS